MSDIYPYAGFWKRFAARLIDGLVLYVAIAIIQQILTSFLISPQTMEQLEAMKQHTAALDPQVFMSIVPLGILWLVLSLVLPWFYFALMESSSKQATLGKMAIGIKVIGLDGHRLSFARALGRTLGKYISGLLLCIGYFMAGTTRRKQALHDKMAKAYVVDKAFQPGGNLPEVAPHTGILISIVITEVLALLAFLWLCISLVMFIVQKVKDNPPAPAVPAAQIQQPVTR